MTILNSTGEEIFKTSAKNQSQIQIAVEQFAEGMYFIRIQQDDKIQMKKFIVVR
jgi:hypothetical protein